MNNIEFKKEFNKLNSRDALTERLGSESTEKIESIVKLCFDAEQIQNQYKSTHYTFYHAFSSTFYVTHLFATVLARKAQFDIPQDMICLRFPNRNENMCREKAHQIVKDILIDSLQNDDHIHRNDLLSVSPNLQIVEHSSFESAVDFIIENFSILENETGKNNAWVNSLKLDAFLKEVKKEELNLYSQYLAKRVDLVCQSVLKHTGIGSLATVSIPKESFSTFGYRSHPFGKPCEKFKNLSEEEILEEYQMGAMNFISDEGPPQYRLLPNTFSPSKQFPIHVFAPLSKQLQEGIVREIENAVDEFFDDFDFFKTCDVGQIQNEISRIDFKSKDSRQDLRWEKYALRALQLGRADLATKIVVKIDNHEAKSLIIEEIQDFYIENDMYHKALEVAWLINDSKRRNQILAKMAQSALKQKLISTANQIILRMSEDKAADKVWVHFLCEQPSFMVDFIAIAPKDRVLGVLSKVFRKTYTDQGLDGVKKLFEHHAFDSDLKNDILYNVGISLFNEGDFKGAELVANNIESSFEKVSLLMEIAVVYVIEQGVSALGRHNFLDDKKMVYQFIIGRLLEKNQKARALEVVNKVPEIELHNELFDIYLYEWASQGDVLAKEIMLCLEDEEKYEKERLLKKLIGSLVDEKISLACDLVLGMDESPVRNGLLEKLINSLLDNDDFETAKKLANQISVDRCKRDLLDLIEKSRV